MFSFEKTFYENSQWWRLITPMFIHFSFAHLAFNCLWVYILGEKIEKRSEERRVGKECER